MIDKQTLAGWGREIETELSSARAELAHEIDRLRNADEFADQCRSAQQSTNLQLAALRNPMAFTLAGRVRALGDRAAEATGAALSIRNTAALLRDRITDLEQAAQQIGVLLAALEPAESEEQADAVS